MSKHECFTFELPHSDIALRSKDAHGIECLGFKPIKVLGKGTFGLVFLVKNKQNLPFALKKVYIPQEHMHKIHPLLSLPRHPNLINLLDFCLEHTNSGDGKIGYELYPKYDMNLEQLIFVLKKHNLKFPPNLFRHTAISLLKAASHLHKHDFIHRDIKPANVLFKFYTKNHHKGKLDLQTNSGLLYDDTFAEEVEVVLADMGPVLYPGDSKQTSYVCTRSYRAPELLLGYLNYTSAIDIWAIACIIAEMCRLKPLFSGESSSIVISKIFAVSENVSPDLITKYSGTDLNLIQSHTISLESKIPSADQKTLKLIQSLLNFDDTQRPSADEALTYYQY